VASNSSTGFDWPAFWRKWGHMNGTKIDLLAMLASDRDMDIDGDWLEQWLRDEIDRRRRELRDSPDSGRGFVPMCDRMSVP
jgi:hypothetical protein